MAATVRLVRPFLTPYIARVEAAGYGGVGSALDDGPAVGEDRHLIPIGQELQHKIVVADGAVGLKEAIEFGEINGTLALVNLHRISAAQGDMRAAFAGKMNEIALAAGAASGPRTRSGDLGMFVVPDVERKQRAPQLRRFRAANQKL